ncbi:unnamed protein product [Blepharisma stoltei]|uniref:Intraflagellar transport protein n=1 Tax=Blepharisma stoltei TaxID=1481888 RepID=A0AAU9JJG8_9CILI|nr:unnamed protein product [Blepharisma stoltei]
MQLRYSKNLQPAVDGMQKISAITWSANGMRLAVSTADRVVHLYDDQGERKDKFPTRPAEKGQMSYVVRALAFSPDSTRLAVAQSDNIVFVYKLGTEWGEKKSICNKFPQSSAVTCMNWPRTKAHDIIFGLAEGKVKSGQVRSNKAATLYSSESYVVSVASSIDGETIISGHLDGTIYRYTLENHQLAKIVAHPSVPYALDWGEHICAAGNDGKVIFYTDDGNVFQRFDYSYDTSVKEFTVAAFNPAGDTVVIGNFNKFFVYGYNPKRPEWVEKLVKNIENLYSVTALCWKPDGSKVVLGSLCGSVDVFEICLRKARYKGKFEFTYVSISQVIVKELASSLKVAIKSDFGLEINKINIYQDRYVVAHTAETLLLGDLETSRLSEIQWRGSGKEKYDFSSPGVCMIFNAGELTLVEYGSNEILGNCRTEQMSPHLISARLNYSRVKSEEDYHLAIKIIAFLLDPHTICVQDLKTGNSAALINHDAKIDFLELNASATKLLYRDKRRQLMLYNIKTQTKSTLLQFCSYVQWVPNSDVVVAQSRNNLNVWYNIDDPDKVTVYNIKGEVEEIERNKNGTEVIVNEGMSTVSYALDEPLIEFGFALESRNLARAVEILEPLNNTPEIEANWKALAEIALEEQNLRVAEQCYSALGDVGKSRYLHKVNKLCDKHKAETAQEGIQSYLVQAKLSALEKQFHRAEAILLDQNDVEEAMEMYQELHRWDEIINIAEKRKHPKLHDLKANYFNWLLQTNQEEKAAEVKARDGDYPGAISLYLKGKLPARAAALVSKYNINNSDIMEKIASALQAAEMHEKAGEFFEKLDMPDKALESYVKGNAYRKAVDLARRNYPTYIAKLEEKWGDYLVSQKQMDASVNHFIEAGAYQKAIEAAINARQWTKAVQLLGQQSQDVAKPYYKQIAKHYADIRQLDQAEKFYMKAGAFNDVFEMLTSNNKWEQAYRFACKNMPDTEVTLLYTKQAQKLESEGLLKEAEKMYLTVNEADMAINMYKKAQQYDNMIKLVAKYRKELLKDTHIYLAQQFDAEGKFKEAEHHFVEAGAWKMAVDIYRKKNMWDEALRLAKAYGGPKEIAEVARKWAETHAGKGGGSDLLMKQGLVEAALEFEVEQRNYDAAFRLAEAHCRHRLNDVHLSYALYLEDENRWKEAEEEFIKAGRAQEAVNMYEHQGDFYSALRVARQYCPDMVPEILSSQAKYHIDRGEFPKAEQCLLAAKLPEKAVEMYANARMRNDAIRVAKDHAPHLVSRVINVEEATGAEDMKQTARVLEQSRDYVKAINAYLSISQDVTNDFDLLEEVWERAVQLAMTYDKDRCQQIIMLVSQRLKGIQRYDAAADMYAGIGQYEEAIKCYIEGKDFKRAKEMVMSIKNTDIEAKLRNLVENEEKKYLQAKGDYTGLMPLDRNAARDIIISGGDWEGALEKVKGNPQMLSEILLKCTTHMTEEGHFAQALKIFSVYGSPADSAFFTIYKTLCVEVLAECEDEEIYDLRTVLKLLLDNMYDRNSPVTKEFERYFRIIQLLYLKGTCKNKNQRGLYTKICVSLLRYTNEVRVDKAFYDAGVACQEEGWLNMAFIFLNRYLDIADAIQDPDTGAAALGDNTDFEGTDIPTSNIPLPDNNITDNDTRDRLRDWVLQVSMDHRVEQKLSTRHCDSCGAEIYIANLQCPNCGFAWEPCLITGFPVMRGSEVACTNCDRPANKNEWNAYLLSNSSCPWCSSIQSQAF